MPLIEMIFRHSFELTAILVLFLLYRILKCCKLIDKIKRNKVTQNLKEVLKIVTIEIYYCSVVVLLLYFIYYQFPTVSMVKDFDTIGKFLFTPPLKYLIIFQVAVGLILGLFSLPQMTLEKIKTPFGEYSVNKKVKALSQMVKEEQDILNAKWEKEVNDITTIYRVRLNMLNTVASENNFGIFDSTTDINENGLYDLITYIQECYNVVFGFESVKAYAIPLFSGSLNLNNQSEIPSLKIIEAFTTKDIVTSADEDLAEIAVPCKIAENSYLIIYLCSTSVRLNREDGEAIQGLWSIIRAIDIETESDGLA